MTESLDDGSSKCCGIRLRKLCLIIGYLHLVSSVLDIVSHLLTVGIITDGFRCDVNMYTFNAIPWLFLEPILLIMNLGTHGFYPFPGIFRQEYNMYLEFKPWPKCYVGMLHIYLADLMNFVLNLIWLRIVISYVGALKKKNTDTMVVFLCLSAVRIVIQIIDFGYHPRLYDVYHPAVYCVFKLVDIIVAVSILMILLKYYKELRVEKTTQIGQNPPSYTDYIIDASLRGLTALYECLEKYKRKVDAVNLDEKKPLPEAEEVEMPPENLA